MTGFPFQALNREERDEHRRLEDEIEALEALAAPLRTRMKAIFNRRLQFIDGKWVQS